MRNEECTGDAKPMVAASAVSQLEQEASKFRVWRAPAVIIIDLRRTMALVGGYLDDSGASL